MSSLLSALKDNPFLLAPMAAITDCGFRSFMREMGCGIVISELVSADGLIHQSQKTYELMRFTEMQRPVGIQIFGEDAGIMAQAAAIVEQTGADFVDINLGCPVPKVVKKGAGAALLRNPQELYRLLVTVKSAIKIPLTIKIRTGWDATTINASDVCQAAHDAGVTWVAIHGRTRAQGYTGLADWDVIARVKARAPLPVLGNGDILTASMAVRRMKESGCDGVMIGRGCLKNPWIFRQALALWQKETEAQTSALAPQAHQDFAQVLHTLKNHIDTKKDPRYAVLSMKKFTGWFSHGYPNSQTFRKQLFTAETADDVLAVSVDYFSRFGSGDQADTSGEAFLMGGHG